MVASASLCDTWLVNNERNLDNLNLQNGNLRAFPHPRIKLLKNHQHTRFKQYRMILMTILKENSATKLLFQWHKEYLLAPEIKC